MLSKEQLLKSLQDLPSKFSVEELMDRVMLLQKIESGLLDSEKGNVYSTNEAKNRLKKWLK